MQIRILGSDLPGLASAGSGDFPGYENMHVAVQRRNRPGEWLGMVPADAPSVQWELDGQSVVTADGVDCKGPYIQGRPNQRFIYLSWGTVAPDGTFTMFR